LKIKIIKICRLYFIFVSHFNGDTQVPTLMNPRNRGSFYQTISDSQKLVATENVSVYRTGLIVTCIFHYFSLAFIETLIHIALYKVKARVHPSFQITRPVLISVKDGTLETWLVHCSIYLHNLQKQSPTVY